MAEVTSNNPKLAVGVVEFLQNEILRGKFPPGSTLAEVPISKQFQTSRTVVREALRSLAEMGLVTLHPHRRATVSSLTPRSVRELFTLRSVLESFAVRLCMTEGRYSNAEIKVIEARYEALRESVVAADEFAVVEADMNFHWAVCSPCGHELLLDQLKSLQTRTRVCIFLTKFYGSDIDSEIEAHAPILAAIRSSHTKAAEESMYSHISNAGERLLMRMSQVDGPKRGRH